MVPSASRVPIFKPTLWLIMTVCANQLVRASGPSTVSLKSFCALIWSSQLIGGMSRPTPSAAVLKASVTSASARSPLPDVTLPSRIAYQRPISSSRALSCATRLRSLSRARKAGCRQAAYARSCAIPHRMILNFIAESMVSSSPACTPANLVIVRYFRPFAAQAQHQRRGRPAERRPGAELGVSARDSEMASLRLDARNLHHLRPLLDVLAQVGVELGGSHHQRHRSLLVPCFLHVGPPDRLVDFGIEHVDDRLRRAGRRHDPEPDGRFVARHPRLGDGGNIG